MSLTPYAFNTFSPNSSDNAATRLGGGGGHHGSGLAAGTTVGAAELNGLLFNERLVYGVGITDRDVGDEEGEATDSNFDKDVYARVALYLKTMTTVQGEQDLWDKTSFRVGVFKKLGRSGSATDSDGHAEESDSHEEEEGGHEGNMVMAGAKMLVAAEVEEDDHHDEAEAEEEHHETPRDFSGNIGDYDVYGVDYRLTMDKVSLFGGLMTFSVDDAEAGTVDEKLFFSEVQYRVYPWLIPFARYEHLETDIHDAEDVERIIPGVAIYPRPNVRCVLELQSYPDDSDQDQILVSADVAF